MYFPEPYPYSIAGTDWITNYTDTGIQITDTKTYYKEILNLEVKNKKVLGL